MTIESTPLNRPEKKSKWLRPLVGVLVAGIFAYLIVKKLDWQAAGAALLAARKSYLLLGVLFLAAGFYTRIVRWWWMLRLVEGGLSLRTCAGPFLAGFALNNILPLRAGDIARTFGFQKHLQSSPMQVLSTLILERLLDVLVLTLFFFAALSGASNAIPESLILIARWLAAASVGLLLGILLFPTQFQRAGSWLLGAGPFRKVPLLTAAFDRFSAALALFKSPLLMLQLLGLSLIAWIFEGGMFASVAAAVNLEVDWRAPWFALSTGTLATTLPGTPGHVGTFDYFAMAGIEAYGAPKEIAAVFALLVHLTLWLPITLAGVLYLLVSRRTSGQPCVQAGATPE